MASSCCVKRVGERHEITIDACMLGVVVVGEHETVVLVRCQQRLAAAQRPHDNESERDRRLTPAVGGHAVDGAHERASMQLEIDLGEQRLHHGDGRAIAQKIPGKLGFVFLHAFEAIETFILHELIGQTRDPAGEEKKHVLQREQPHDAAGRVDHRDLPQPVPPHGRHRVEKMVPGRW